MRTQRPTPRSEVNGPAVHPVVYYDGVCGFCNATVQFLLRHDRKGELRFAALQSPAGDAMRDMFPDLRNIDSIILLEFDRQGVATASVRSTAALRICSYLGGIWRIPLAAVVLPRGLRDRLYDAFARRRYRFFGRSETCIVPDPESRSRFLDNGTPYER